MGAGSPGISTGMGPLTYYHSLSGNTGVAGAARSAKVQQAQQVNAIWERLLNVHQHAFTPAGPRTIAREALPDQRGFTKAKVRAALHDTPWWRWGTRRRLKAQARQLAVLEFPGFLNQFILEQEAAERAEQERWNRLLANEPAVTMQQLADAFADNEMPSAPVGVEDDEATIAVLAPPDSSLPDRIGGVTDAGNVSLRRVPKGQRRSLATSITCGYALVTAREAFAVAPGLQSTRVVVLSTRQSAATDPAELTQLICVLAARWERTDMEGELWQQVATEHGTNAVALASATASELLINLKGQSLQPLDLDAEPDLQRLLAAVDQEWLVDE
jgi:hypothetical protein